MKKIGIIVLILLIAGVMVAYQNEKGNNNEVVEESPVVRVDERIPSKFACVGEFCDGSGVGDDIEFTLLNIPLVVEGKKFGCGFDIKYFPHVVSQTPAPLAATYQLLFDIKLQPENVGDEFRNTVAAYPQLSFDSVILENGVARVYLIGLMSGPGHCSVPELRQQVLDAALQYDTVNQVEVYVNGVLYDWCVQDESDGEGLCPETPDYWQATK